ncbi:acyclic terpene utilization AtuA family protein [Burkholderia cenocepacia]|uniref:acyclic terpene utilization AtuA family protein n=1 Tax=Burkholderia cenocepacia TaxID=95486 RepID=UPI000980EA54|nr:acyclic terpene utilization AtuA family protein [Burkholderia cenocepacia]ONT25834.1 ABC transporter substrate-binding protein [Burkholderia cenocepacia]ONT56002.1 ABC transporter substrate-binding protein [Burkholderia cenocepacia]ONT65188.1 ABC transporter substrate-binding protein [Burkholderia cenocepacia]ONT75401.1 ABC transporter substrate-binding protein [Burkholderia cenocepacia]ONT75761.1 ABC transporter substrate-binding protein [Burkholderia cenocepacia]
MTAKQPERRVRIGAGAGYSGDRIEPAVELAEHGQLDYLVFECLAERTIAIAQQARRNDPALGYDPLLDARMHAVLPVVAARRVRIVSNMGAANPRAAARRTAQIAQSLGIAGLKVAAVEGDDVLDVVLRGAFRFEESGDAVAAYRDRIVSANAYLGAAPIVDALAAGADVVLTGRVADPSLFAAPLIHAFGWRMDDWDRLGQATVVGHLLECAGQVTGGYFADPGYKDVPNLARLGFPIGEVVADGAVVITKVPHAGGRVSAATCKEQLLYEIHDPARYLQPDVVADFTRVAVAEEAADRVRVTGGRGTARPDTLKVSVAYVDGWIGEGQISYGGPGALARARLALDIVRERLALTGVAARELRFDLIGVDALYGDATPAVRGEPAEVRVRVAGRAANAAEAARIGNEVETLYTNGPAGGGGAFKSTREVIAVQSVLLPRAAVTPSFSFVEA